MKYSSLPSVGLHWYWYLILILVRWLMPPSMEAYMGVNAVGSTQYFWLEEAEVSYWIIIEDCDKQSELWINTNLSLFKVHPPLSTLWKDPTQSLHHLSVQKVPVIRLTIFVTHHRLGAEDFSSVRRFGATIFMTWRGWGLYWFIILIVCHNLQISTDVIGSLSVLSIYTKW